MFFFTLRYIIKNHRKSIFIISGIIFSVMLMFSLIQMGDSISLRYRQFLTSKANQDLKVGGLNFNEAQSLKKLLGKYETSLNGLIGNIHLSDEDVLQATMCAADENEIKKMNAFEVAEGKFPEALYEIAIESSVNQRLEKPLAVGSRITFPVELMDGRNIPMEFRISGFMKDTQMQSMSSGLRSFAFVSFATIQDLEGKGYISDHSYSLDIMISENSYSEKKVNDLTNACIDILKPYYPDMKTVIQKISPNEEKMNAYSDKKSMNPMGAALKALAAVISVSMLLLVFNSVNLMVVERIRQYGTLRCIGMSKRQLLRMIFWEILCYSLIGSAIGLACGVVMNGLVGKRILSLLLNEQVELVQTAGSYIFTILLAFLAVFLAAANSFRKLKSLTPNETLHYSENTKNTAPTKESFHNFFTYFAVRNIKRNRTKSVTVVLSLTVCITLLLIIVNGFLSIPKQEKNLKQTFSDYEIVKNYIDQIGNLTENIPNETLDQLRQLSGVQEVYAFNVNMGVALKTLDGEIISCQTYNDALLRQLLAMNSAAADPLPDVLLFYPLPDKNLEPAKPNCLDGMSLKEGDIIECSVSELESGSLLSGRESVQVQRVLTGLDISLGGNMRSIGEGTRLIISEKEAERLFGKVGYWDIMLSLDRKPGEEFVREISSIFRDLPSVTHGGYETGTDAAAKQLVAMLFLACYLIAAAAITGIFNMSNTIKANIESRGREYGMLRAVGMSKRAMIKTICLENLILVLIALAVSIFIAIPVQIYISNILLGEVQIKIWTYLLVPALSFSACGLLCFRQAKRTCGKNIIEKLAEE